MHHVEALLHAFLGDAALGNATVPDEIFKEFGKRCEEGLRKHLLPEKDKGFTLRMSNIGRPLRQLMLEKAYGKATPMPDFILKMLDGTLKEALLFFLMKASGIGITAQDAKVSLEVAGRNIEGTLDLILHIDDKVYDVKSASDYAFKYKFDSWESIALKDDFGYLGQGFGYAKAKNKKFGGWIVINKSTSDFKVVEIPNDLHDDLMQKYIEELEYKVNHINDNVMPPCDNIIEETYYKKPTGNLILGEGCRFCPHKDKCHPGIQYLPSRCGKSENYKWYIEVNDKESTGGLEDDSRG
jgi:hypothetical protein